MGHFVFNMFLLFFLRPSVRFFQLLTTLALYMFAVFVERHRLWRRCCDTILWYTPFYGVEFESANTILMFGIIQVHCIRGYIRLFDSSAVHAWAHFEALSFFLFMILFLI
jgi:hypothetical protein